MDLKTKKGIFSLRAFKSPRALQFIIFNQENSGDGLFVVTFGFLYHSVQFSFDYFTRNFPKIKQFEFRLFGPNRQVVK